jgi:hypothetical protein
LSAAGARSEHDLIEDGAHAIELHYRGALRAGCRGPEPPGQATLAEMPQPASVFRQIWQCTEAVPVEPRACRCLPSLHKKWRTVIIHDVVDHLPEQTAFGDAMYAIYVRQKLGLPLQAAEEGRVTSQQGMDKKCLNDAR